MHAVLLYVSTWVIVKLVGISIYPISTRRQTGKFTLARYPHSISITDMISLLTRKENRFISPLTPSSIPTARSTAATVD